MSNAELVDTIAHILEPWAFETKSYNATIARDDATAKATQIVEALAALDSRAGDAGEGVWRQTALDVAKDCQRVRHSSATPQERDTALRQAATMLRSFADAATPAPAVDAQEEGRPCDTCQGNGEVVTDWERYMHRKPGDTGDEGTKDCPDCNGTGRVDGPNAVDAVPAGEVERLARIRTSMALLQQNSEGCAQNHYGDDAAVHGMPGWLVDTKADLDAFTKILARREADCG